MPALFALRALLATGAPRPLLWTEVTRATFSLLAPPLLDIQPCTLPRSLALPARLFIPAVFVRTAGLSATAKTTFSPGAVIAYNQCACGLPREQGKVAESIDEAERE